MQCRYVSNDTLRWRHNDHDGVSNQQPHGCLLNHLLRRRSKKTSKLCVTGLCVGKSPGPVNSPHKGPVTRKMFLFDDVIMNYTELYWITIICWKSSLEPPTNINQYPYMNDLLYVSNLIMIIYNIKSSLGLYSHLIWYIILDHRIRTDYKIPLIQLSNTIAIGDAKLSESNIITHITALRNQQLSVWNIPFLEVVCMLFFLSHLQCILILSP